MNTAPTELSVESIEAVLVEKESALAKEQAMLEGLKGLLRSSEFPCCARTRMEETR